jgi:hypothetical protein
MRIRQVLIISLLICSSVLAQTYYVDPVAGLDTNPGTITQPFQTISYANSKMNSSGGYIYLRGGTYSYSAKISLTKIATALSTIKIWAYNNEIPLIDFAGEATGTDGISLSGDYYHLKGLEIVHSGHNGIICTGHHNIIEACKIHSNRNSGFGMGGSTDHGYYPSYNLILNTDSYLNYDPPIGGNGDGFAPKWYIGAGNVFRGCRAWQNSDDGWDLWMADSTIEIDSCFSFRNGVNSWGVNSQFNGNGNGFKLGGNYVATPHIVKNCVSFDNAGNTGRGYDENNDTAGQTLYNCVAYRNMGDNYHFTNNPITGHHIIKNCISYSGNVSISNAILSNNSWPSLTPTATDFVSLDTSLAVAPRQANGNLPDNGFFRLKAGSKFIDAGVNVGIPFMGSAPDIGAFEYLNMNLSLTAFIQGYTNTGGTAMNFAPSAVTVELHNATTPYALVESQTGSLSTAGVGTFNFTTAVNGTNYYIAVKTWNTVETWSATAQSFTSGALSYDFTSLATQAYASNMMQIGTKWCIFSGDVNQDGYINLSDYVQVNYDSYHLVTGVVVTDLTGDQYTNLNDYVIVNYNSYNLVVAHTPLLNPAAGMIKPPIMVNIPK